MKREVLPIHETSALPSDGGFIKGQWYWVATKARWDDEPIGTKKGDKYEWLGCVSEVGTNYVELQAPHSENGYNNVRVHFDKAHKKLRPEIDAETVIRESVDRHRYRIDGILNEIRELTARLGFRQDRLSAPNEPGTALAVVSGVTNVKRYEVDLRKAKDKTLPDLFKAIQNETKELNRWMLAATMPLRIEAAGLEDVIGEIDGRIFNISLYAGLTEEVVRCRKGETAPATEKLHVLQRRLYMDEECLLNYSAGGMEFNNIEEFDEWIAKPENCDRILPFARSIVSMRVRRHDKERESYGSLWRAYVNVRLAKLDKLTFLYIRNGDQVWRLSCDQDFGEMLFPNADFYGGGRALMIKPGFGRVEEFMPVSEYEVRVAEAQARAKELAAWRKAHPKKGWMDEPYELRNDHGFRAHEWEPFDSSSVYFDDAGARIKAQIDSYNRIVLILQGLFDRSPVLHPHPPVNLWRPDHMEQHVKLVYDALTLYAGEKPDFEAYRTRLNASIAVDSLLTGQRYYWMAVEATKENQARRRRGGSRYYGDALTHFEPYGNPGPEAVCRPAAWHARSKKALFAWQREASWRSGYRFRQSKMLVPASDMLNVSAYVPGDYKQFFRDPRTREEYLKWAPLLLAAEDWYGTHRKKIKRERL